MADNTKLEPRSPPSISQPTPTSPVNPLKRKEPPGASENEQKRFSPAPALPAGVTDTHQGEYEKGRITCEVCGTGVGFRDEETGGFTLKHWEAHRLTCSMPGQSSTDPVIYTPESTAEALAHPPAKRRRAKRTEEERIDYLRADPYVAQFEAYRVLCASCDKWIRLRPNSTYCSIPWDAHRKSCLAKKVNSKNVYALEERNALFSKDPDIRKFDAERVLCSICDKWLSVNPDDHLQAVQKWLQHRAACQKNSTPTLPPHRPILPEPVSAPPLTEQQMAVAIGPGPGPTSSRGVQPPPPHSVSPISPKPGPSFAHSNSAQPRIHPSDNPSFHDYNPSNYAPTHESRRRNAEQRAATLRADSLISEVEPNRVFCSLCQKWVQLRQDSSYCAYPWLQHRGKCLARHQRRVQKVAETADFRNRKHPVSPEEEDELMSENDGGGGTDGPESEEGLDSHAEEDRFRRKEVRRVEPRHAAKDLQRGNNGKARARSAYHFPPHQSQSRHSLGATSTSSSAYRHDPRGGPLSYHRMTNSRIWDDDVDGEADGGIDVDTYMIDDDRTISRVAANRAQPIRRPLPVGLADLDSPPGRRDFVFASIEYLFRTTYETTDDMTISALLVYLNAAMPQDKHEDFDTAEVTKSAAQLHDKGRIIFEGDLIRLPD
ncbi:hypothetical protein M378DRAFT_15215 [Amanita muscaria Koide BX008]|uniref:Uncharacterized protein n=1 Tax=Amanita muscaria (strain Koide BX008) TaxID=946122 RepID=A0A0C2WQ86_AMAMK|nr:hypothetical protein M378DRAFT_15215 [Amanita muscaria Koide BX008]